jgi:Fe-Mn family superoxide dismutase
MPTRRQVLKSLAVATFATSAFAKFSPAIAADAPAATGPSGPYKLPPLPYGYDALEPSIDAETMHLHHDKHHAGYVKKLNEALAKEPSFTPPANVDDLVAHLDQVPESIRTAVRNQGGGHANHSLFWLTLGGSQRKTHLTVVEAAPVWQLGKAIDEDIGGRDKLKATMTEEGGKVFGSGWVWLVLDGGKKLTVMTTANQDSPLTEGHYPLFGIDVWEHAYYLKYKNVRADYLKAIWAVINWDFISARYDAAMKA